MTLFNVTVTNNNMNTEWIKKLQTPIALVGLGKSGKAAYQLLLAVGFSEKVILTYDDKDASAGFSNGDLLASRNPKTLVVSPGFPLKTPWIEKLIQSGCFLTSEISLAASIITTEKIIGVTGSIGKSTVVSLIGEALLSDDPNTFIGGNLGTPFCQYALDLLKERKKANWIVLELSSYQLENCAGLKLLYSAITYLSPNHLERYDSLEEYYNTKIKIISLTSKKCVLNSTSEDILKMFAGETHSILFTNSSKVPKLLLDHVNLIGKHNKDNFAVAYEIIKLCGLTNENAGILAMQKYKGLSHRLENVGTRNGVTYINDSKATAIDSVLVATYGCLENLSTNNLLYLLLGGKDKNLPWEDLAILKTDARIRFVFFGQCGKEISYRADLGGPYFTKLGKAVEYCKKTAVINDVVLLSPGGTSLDEFKNFEERGDYFRKLINQQND